MNAFLIPTADLTVAVTTTDQETDDGLGEAAVSGGRKRGSILVAGTEVADIVLFRGDIRGQGSRG